jgi:dolichol kinase
MDKHEIQRKIFTIAATLMMVSVLALIAVFPGILLDTSTETPLNAAIGTLIGMGLHLLLAVIFYRARRSNRPKRRINREIHLFWALGMIFLGFIMMDGAFNYLNQVLYVSIGIFLVVLCDFAAALVFVAALFLLKPEKKK